jgi:2-polyprenyl-3-methyl-5-hydroxy-6-metoxy-1,4-benzoquinol methylase
MWAFALLRSALGVIPQARARLRIEKSAQEPQARSVKVAGDTRTLTGAQIRQGDSVLQSWRIRKAAPYIPRGAHILDIGCGDGALFRALQGRIASGVGIDTAPVPGDHGSFRFIQGYAPEALPEGDRYDAITMLAVLEHIPPEAQRDLAAMCVSLLRPQGRIVCTVPSPKVDSLIHLGQRLRILDGMAEHEHYGFEPADTVRLFTESGFTVHRARRFQLGLNNLFVFSRPDDRARSMSRA